MSARSIEPTSLLTALSKIEVALFRSTTCHDYEASLTPCKWQVAYRRDFDEAQEQSPSASRKVLR
jgi:hypothetical protein